MKLFPVPVRARRTASLVAVAGVAALLPVVGTTGAATAAPESDCTETFPVADVTRDQQVTGLTVSRGTEPEGFSGSVIGVLEDGVAPGVDMIIADLTSPAIEAAGGIWQGMSGSPVYAADGRIIGAVAYGLSDGPSPIAGITPFDVMDDHLATREEVPLRADLARRVARSAGVSTQEASRGLTELRVPFGVSGVSPRVLAGAARAAKDRRWFTPGATVAGRAPAAPAGPSADDLAAGGNLVASMAYGDVAMTAAGTATSVCEDRVVGFGHPLAFAGGDQTYGLHPAEAVYVQPESLGSPFKVVNVGSPVGTITDDRLGGVTGSLGETPAVTTVRSDVTAGGKRRIGNTYVTTPAALAEAAFYTHLGNRTVVVDAQGPAVETQRWLVQGVDSDGTPFRFSRTQTFAERGEYSTAAFALPELLEAITSIDGVRVTSVLNQVVVRPNARTYRIGRLQQVLKGGRLVTVDFEERPAVTRPGGVLKLKVNLLGDTRPRARTLTFRLPRLAGFGALLVRGGASADDEEGYYYEEIEMAARRAASPELSELQELLRSLPRPTRPDVIQVDVQLGGEDEEDEGLVRTYTSTPLGSPVTGARFAGLVAMRGGAR